MRSMPSLARVGAFLAFFIASSGCTAEGRYVIRGTLRGEGVDGAPAALSHGTVHADGGRGGGSRPVETGDDGAFTLDYGFGGLALPFLTGNDNPELIFSAPGYQTRTVRLRSDRTDSGISRAGCTRCNEGTCCGIDAVLQRARTPPASTP